LAAGNYAETTTCICSESCGVKINLINLITLIDLINDQLFNKSNWDLDIGYFLDQLG
jgi:L-lactate utilization protein LutB